MTMTLQESRELVGKLAGNVEAAKHALGAALLVERGVELITKGKDVENARRTLAAAQQELQDAEAMALAIEAMELQLKDQAERRRQMREFDQAMAPRVTIEQVQAEKKLFEYGYAELKGSPALVERAKALLALARKCGQRSEDDIRRFLRSLGGSPELKAL